MDCIAVVTTVATRAQALDLAHALVASGLAACAQISAIDSVYVWDGAVQQEPECRVLFKTLASRYGEVETAILARHPYQLPAIHALPISAIHAPYAAWVAENSRGGAS